MAQKVAVALVHGIGEQTDESNVILGKALMEQTEALCGKDAAVFKIVFWAPVLAKRAEALWNTLRTSATPKRYLTLRHFIINYIGDMLAYQIGEDNNRTIYDQIHSIYANTLRQLAQEAGESAPLVVVAHSLGTVITSNYIYDVQKEQMRRVSRAVRQMMGESPLERGDTLACLYTLGSPLPIWSLRYENFGSPIHVPSPNLNYYHPGLKGEWVNYYDADDIIGFPLKPLNDAYNEAVIEDREVNIGRIYESWNPLSHLGYWRDDDIVKPIARSIHKIWQQINPAT